MRTGRVPACSEPRVGLRSASQISPRLIIIRHLLSSSLRRNPSCLLQPDCDPLRQIQHTRPTTAFHQRCAPHCWSDILETLNTRRPLLVPPHSRSQVLRELVLWLTSTAPTFSRHL